MDRGRPRPRLSTEMRERTQRRQRIAASALAVLLAGCAALPPLSPRPPCHALADTDGTALARLFAAARAAHPGESGYALFDDGRASATTRFDLAAVAERSIDLQTFAWSDDVMGGATWSALLGAAARGVRVRVLVDDVALDGRARLPCRPNLEIRVINPFAQRRFRLFELLRRFATLDRRMHNKLYVVDGQVAFVGGRNVGDAYFGLGRRYNYRDLDVATVGPVVAQAEAAFDAYWNSARAYPASAFCDASP